jgi:predicted nucleic acid-binding protein
MSFVRLVMNENWVLDASPIILLGKADLLKTVSPLATLWIIPEGVIREVEAKRPIESYLSDISSGSEVVREHVSNINPSIAAWDLGRGESEVLTLALEKAGAGAVLDDLQARKCAALFDISLIGSLGLILLTKRKGLLHLAKPEIERLKAVGLHIDPIMLTRILTRIGENDKTE